MTTARRSLLLDDNAIFTHHSSELFCIPLSIIMQLGSDLLQCSLVTTTTGTIITWRSPWTRERHSCGRIVKDESSSR
ncbi:hypothetical protein EUGRSUZ_D01782 [Eucalyptus grandis]|uniref:Uncharacterized protein n=2 Tax=Eucalyptus grandis TaxID=71139 RepID=A0ACC3L6N5_EUCGR|nr:hypothetical protein EUGRSUZ_D01782 [Eucalyptus grandis]